MKARLIDSNSPFHITRKLRKPLHGLRSLRLGTVARVLQFSVKNCAITLGLRARPVVTVCGVLIIHAIDPRRAEHIYSEHTKESQR